MRSIWMVIIMVFCTNLVRSQVLISLLLGDKLNSNKIEFGLDGGINFPQLRGIDGGNLKANFNLGFYFDFKLKNPQWMIHTGVMVKSSMGTNGLPVYPLNNEALDSVFVNGEVRKKFNYFNVPIEMKYEFDNHFFVMAGVMPGLRAKVFDIFTSQINDNDLEYKANIDKQIHRLDFGLIGGVGYRLMRGKGMNFLIQYYYGLVDITIDDATPRQFNTSIYISAEIPIGASKAKAKSSTQ